MQVVPVYLFFHLQTERHGYKYTKNQPEIFAVVKRWKKVVDEYEKRDGKVRYF